MKKFTFALMALLAFTFSLKAQQYVSTQPSNRNVILEEFTGRGCQYCPDGHRIANEIAAAHPERFWAINVHAGYYAQTSYPNFNTPDGTTIHNGFSISGYPCGVVNRSTSDAIDRGQWANQATNQMSQASECNVAGMVIVNPVTRVATINVEVYYTANSASDQNYLTVAMLQDSILGSQSGAATWNPTQMINGQYVHMHILRDVINESAWGEAISPTTQGTLITRTYTYEIPEVIGSPNGVNVELDNIFFLAWVSERQQGSATRPILTGCELGMVYGSNDPVYPMVYEISQVGTTCSHTKEIEISVQNVGTEPLTSLKLDVEMDGVTQTISWEGELPVFGMERIGITLDVPFGIHPVNVAITEANGAPFSSQSTGSIECLEWVNFESEAEEEELKVMIVQDKNGQQTTWEIAISDGTIIASGGPYQTLAGGNATQAHLEIVNVPVNECVKFTIKDSAGNGICCSNGQGYYLIKDSHNNVLVGDVDDGDFGSSATHLISVGGSQAMVEVGTTEVQNVTYNHADFISSLVYEGYPDQVGFECHKVTSSNPMIIPGILNEFQKILGSTDELEHSSIYMVRAFAVVNGETYYGTETTFQTWTEGVSEFEQALKIYPNPTSGVLNIQGEGMKSVEVYNTIGQCVMTQEVNGEGIQLSTESLNNGIYFLRVRANDGAVLNRTFSVAR